MADRTVLYRLIADATQFKAGMAGARAATMQTGAALDSTSKKSSAMASVTAGAAATVALALGTKIVSAAANFDQAMSGVQAATHESAASMDALRQAALEAGSQTKFSATEAALGIENLAKAGVSTSDILGGGLTGALDLAAAGELEVGQAAEIAATALTQFNLAGEDVPHVADLLAAGAGKAQGEVTDLAAALNQSGLVAAQMGLSIEETTGSLAAFASAGLLGSDAGTSLKTMLLRLANPSKEAARTMERFGISAYDAQGNLLPMAEIAGQVQSAFKGQSQATRDAALATIFGSDAIRAANVLYNEGAEGITEWTAKVDDAGFAAETAAIRMDNLKGDLEILMGSIETGLIGAGDGSQESLRGTTQAATGLLDILNQINETSAVQGATDQLALGGASPAALKIGLSNLIKTRNAIFGVDEEQEKAADSAEELAGAELYAANAATQHAAAAQQSAAEIEAQEEALKKARDAARDTATAFFNLGESLNDSKVSLGDWIKEMANQADALDNFTSNAEKAANKGLRQGLINALKEAGPEGALRMKQLSNATEAEINKANAAWSKGEKAIDRYVDATAGVPDSVTTTLFMDSRGALAALAQARREMDALDGKTVQTIIEMRTVYRNSGNVGDALPDRRREAAGGPIFGPGTATSDSIPALLSNGEYVIKAAAVEHYGMGTFDRLNAMRFADGGEVKKGKRRNLNPDSDMDTIFAQGFGKQILAMTRGLEKAAQKQVNAAEVALLAAEDQQEAAENDLQAAEQNRDTVQQLRDSLAASVSSQFSSSLTGRGLAGLSSTLGMDINGGATMDATLRALTAAGLDTTGPAAGLFQELAASNDLRTANELLASPDMIATLEAQYAQRASINAARGSFAADASFGASVAAAQQAVLVQQQVLAATTAATAQMQANLDRQSAQLDTLTSAVREQAQRIGEVINDTAHAGVTANPRGR